MRVISPLSININQVSHILQVTCILQISCIILIIFILLLFVCLIFNTFKFTMQRYKKNG